MTEQEETRLQLILTAAHNSYEKGLNRFALFKVHNTELSEDLVQSTFMKTWKYLVRGGQVETLKAFLYHVLNCLIVDEYRKHKSTSLDVMVEKGFELEPEDYKQIFNSLDGRSAQLLIRSLPSKYQGVMNMRFIKMLSLKEISLLTGQTRNTVAVQVHRGIAKLRVLYHLAENP